MLGTMFRTEPGPCEIPQKKQGATGITTVAPYVAGQWGRGNNRLPGRLQRPELVPAL